MTVIDKKEIRMYDLKTGKLDALHNNVFEGLSNPNGEITKFIIDKPHRKAYVADNNGSIIVINCQTGVKLKNVTQYLEDKAEIRRANDEKDFKDGASLYSETKKKGENGDSDIESTYSEFDVPHIQSSDEEDEGDGNAN